MTPALKQPRPDDFLEQARTGLQLVARFLECPNAAGLDNVGRCLQVVVGQVQACQAMVRDPAHRTPEFSRAIAALKDELAHVNVMFREAGTLFGGWKRVLSTRLGGYTRQGRPAPLRCRQQLAIKI